MFIPIIIATGVIAVLGLIVGVFLGFANKIFNVPTDEKVSQIRECLPGNNCGGCGYSGCDGLACAIAEGKAPVNACPVGGAEASKEISKIMGVETPNDVRKVAFVKCSGSCDKTQFVYQYFGTNNCHQVSLTPGRGSKACAYSCTGLGSCMNACSFDAIKIVNGRAQVMPDKCHGCGSCVSICPNHLIELIPANALYVVRCFSQEKGKKVRDMCAVGCLGAVYVRKFALPVP